MGSQENVLLKKIRRASLRDESTITFAKHLLRGHSPISRSTWHMLINLNPEHHKHPQQYVLWNGKYIQVNGSFGGKEKLICNYDLAYKKQSAQNTKKKTVKHNILNRKNGLLPNSLTRKSTLDDLHQDNHIGNIAVTDLPKPELDIQPQYGTAFKSTTTNFLNNMYKEDGTISRKWAELAVLGKNDKSNAIQLNTDCVAFNKPNIIRPQPACINTQTDISTVLPEIKDMMNRMLDSVEFSIIQDDMYIGEQEKRQSSLENLNIVDIVTNVKDTAKRKFCELDRLDVTVIQLPEIKGQDFPQSCSNMHCSLGRICASLDCTYNVRQHCGRVNCMFNCKCNFFRHISDFSSAVSSEVLPGILNLDNEINSKLAKEEQNFRQNVIVTDKKRILLKAHKRNWNTSKKLTDFYNTMSLRHENQDSKMLSVVALKIDCDNIESWCMVHKLYKCFCKGKFTEICRSATNESLTKKHSSTDTVSNENCLEKCTLLTNEDNLQEYNLRPRPKRTYLMRKSKIRENADDKKKSSCSRTKAYEGRKHTDDHYKNTNYRILEMEKNDKRLRKRLASLNNNSYEEETENESNTISINDTTRQLELCDDSEIVPSSIHYDDDTIKTSRKRLLSETKLVAWLESNYKQYKHLNDQGLIKNSLEPPKPGKIALHPWDFILNRYREQKNLFLISQQKPYRIFMAVHTRNPFFENCININDIHFADFHKYPHTVKNLLINATDLQDNFCILQGLSFCWELIGSVTKVNEGLEDTPEITVECPDRGTLVKCYQNETRDVTTEQTDVQRLFICRKDFDSPLKLSEDSGSSKWFAMIVENDISEIRFVRKRFFVKYESIVNAVSVARKSGKTIRLSKTCAEQSDIPQFGIYASPDANENCIFIGPYEMEETLGIETIKRILDVGKIKKTRGFWIRTNKVENLKVIENPLLFMHSHNPQNDNMLPLERHFSTNDIIHESSESLNEVKDAINWYPCKTEINDIKSIKLRKLSSVYNMASDNVLKNFSVQDVTKTVPVKLNSLSNSVGINTIPLIPQAVAELASQIKISAAFSQNETSLAKNDNQNRGVFILKPEEINRKLLESKLKSEETYHIDFSSEINDETSSHNLMESDLNGTVPESALCSTDNVFVVSDDENEISVKTETGNNENSWVDVWIECTDTTNVGWIVGRKNKDNNLLSFKLPESEYSEFYLERHAFININMELFKRTKNSAYLDFKWKVKTSSDLLQGHEIDLKPLYLECIDLTDESNEIDKG